MFYPASEKLLARFPTREDNLRAVDELLHQHGGDVLVMKNAAFILDLSEQSLAGLLDCYAELSVVSKEERAKCPRCIDELIELSSPSTWYCDHCGGTFDYDTPKKLECYRVTPSPKPKTTKHEDLQMLAKERIAHGRTRPWDILPEEDYLRSVTTLGAADQEWILHRLQLQGFCLLRWQGMSPSEHQLRSIEEFLGPVCTTQNGFNGKIKEINPTEAAEANTGDSAKELLFHTDGTQDGPLPPAILVFQYLTTPTLGGLSTFLDLTPVVLGLTEDEQLEILTELSYPDAAVCEKKGLRYEGPLVKPVCADQALSFRLRFDDKINVADRSESGFQRFKQRILSETKYLKYAPHEGDIAIFDNWRILHGRKSIEGGRHLRFHNRMWIKDLDDRHKGRYLLGVRGISSELILKVKQTNIGL